MLDGEVVALDDDGRATFSAMQQGKPGTRYLFVAFDLLEVDNEPVVGSPLAVRRRRLDELVDKRNRTVQVSDVFDDGEALFRAAKEQGFEGIVAKRADSRYEPGRHSHSWVKVKARNRDEFVIGGYTKGRRAPLGHVRLAPARGLRRRRLEAALRRQRGHGVQREGDRPAAAHPARAGDEGTGL